MHRLKSWIFAIVPCALLMPLGAASQNPDSLRAIWNDDARPDTVRFAAMEQLIGSIKYSIPPDSLLALAGQLFVFAEQRGMERQMGTALLMQGNGYMDMSDMEHATDRLERARRIFEGIKDRRRLARTFNSLGNLYYVKGDLAQAIEHLTNGLRIAEELKDSSVMARTLGNIGVMYYVQGDFPNALDYYQRRIVVADAIGDKQCASEAWSNMAIIHQTQGEQQLAMEEFTRAMAMAKEIGDATMEMSCLQNIGALYTEMGDHDRAMDHLTRSVAMAEAQGDPASVSNAFVEIGESFRDRGNTREALGYAKRALAIAQEAGATGITRDAAGLAYEMEKKLGNAEEALAMHELHIALRDSVASDENKQAIMQQRFQYDYEKKEALLEAEQEKKDAVAAEELRRKNVQRNAFIGGFGLMLLLAGTFFIQRNRISKEKRRSEELLLNILPAEVAEELKAKGEAEAVQIDQVTVLFTDFKGFTAMSEQLGPKELVRDIHECFSAFDRIMGKHGIEKIKTIGDAYMAAGGLPTPNVTHALDVVKAALEVRDFIAAGKAHKVAAGLPYFEIRIGVHTGPVVAGIVGVKKFAYDIWGDTVNIASRMESSGEAGRVNISENTFEQVRNEPGLSFTSRGKVSAKGKGEMEMYFVERG